MPPPEGMVVSQTAIPPRPRVIKGNRRQCIQIWVLPQWLVETVHAPAAAALPLTKSWHWPGWHWALTLRCGSIPEPRECGQAHRWMALCSFSRAVAFPMHLSVEGYLLFSAKERTERTRNGYHPGLPSVCYHKPCALCTSFILSSTCHFLPASPCCPSVPTKLTKFHLTVFYACLKVFLEQRMI